MKLPDYVIIGTQRCGTSSLFLYITTHPDCHGMTNEGEWRQTTDGDEIHFFDYDRNWLRGEEWYSRHIFSDGVWGEKSPTYLHCGDRAADRMNIIMPDVRLIMLYRDPVARAYSHYWKAKIIGHEALPTFEQALDAEPIRLAQDKQGDFENSNRHLYAYTERGLYARHMRVWLDYFTPEQFIIIQSEYLFDYPHGVTKAVWRELGLEDVNPCFPIIPFQANRYPRLMKEATRERLERQFKPHNEEWERMLCTDLTNSVQLRYGRDRRGPVDTG